MDSQCFYEYVATYRFCFPGLNLNEHFACFFKDRFRPDMLEPMTNDAKCSLNEAKCSLSDAKCSFSLLARYAGAHD
jgi:hypothetical protein